MPGALLFSTDDLRLNERNGIHFGDEFTKIDLLGGVAPGKGSGGGKGGSRGATASGRMEWVLARLHRYVLNRTLLHEHALATQRRMLHLTSADEFARLTFEYIESKVAS